MTDFFIRTFVVPIAKPVIFYSVIAEAIHSWNPIKVVSFLYDRPA